MALLLISVLPMVDTAATRLLSSRARVVGYGFMTAYNLYLYVYTRLLSTARIYWSRPVPEWTVAG